MVSLWGQGRASTLAGAALLALVRPAFTLERRLRSALVNPPVAEAGPTTTAANTAAASSKAQAEGEGGRGGVIHTEATSAQREFYKGALPFSPCGMHVYIHSHYSHTARPNDLVFISYRFAYFYVNSLRRPWNCGV